LFDTFCTVSRYLTKLSEAQYGEIQALLDTQTVSPLVISGASVPGSRTYQLQLTLTNWVGGSSNSLIEIEKSALNIPRVVTSDTADRITLAGNDFKATVEVMPSACTTADDFAYLWEQISGPVISLPKGSGQMFFIPRDTLTPGTTYAFRVTISLIPDPARKNTKDLVVRVLPSALKAVIADGDRLFSISNGQPLKLDAGNAFDPDVGRGRDDTLGAAWSCSVLPGGSPCFDEDTLASFVFRSPSSSAKTLTVPSTSLAPFAISGQTLAFKMALTKESRRALAEVRIQVTEEVVPAVAIATSSGDTKVAADKKMSLLGDAVSNRAESFTYMWNVLSNNLNLSDASILLTPRTSKDLVLREGAMQPGAEYEFELLAYADGEGKPGKAYRSVVVNKAPTSGKCVAVPAIGLAFDTVFTLQCTGWEDLDLPLTFEYKIKRNGANINLLTAEGSNKCETQLGPGPNQMVAFVRDFFGAETVVEFTVDVTPSPPNPERNSNNLDSLNKASTVTKNINKYSQSFLELTSSLALDKVQQAGGAVTRRLLADDNDEASVNATNAMRVRVATRRMMAETLVAMSEGLVVVTSDTLRQSLQMVAELLLDASEVDCSFRTMLSRMIRTIVDSLASKPALEVPVDAMTAVVRGLNGMLESVQLDLIIPRNITDTTVTNATNATNATDATNATSATSLAEESSARGSLESGPSVKSEATTADGSACPSSLFDEGAELAEVMGDAIRKALLKAIANNVPGERPLVVSGGGITLLGQRNTDFTGELALPGGAAFDLPSELNPSGGEAFDMVAVVSDADPFKYAESTQFGNDTGKVGFSGSVSLSFSNPMTGPVAVRNLATPILITIAHLPLAENASIECRYNTTTQQNIN
jgi:hypothetical protein